ncbi:NAD(P)-binding protein [Mycena rosella]|uniref:NAD(P)-binding protein n=1 Tax=Mycena rosella TaxID=1033263 RepID=A0AAD7D4I4_MYCRO|nr:NAD(P)-binding protein [Mycena rosella]
MSIYKSFAVVGGGLIGLPIVNALAARNVSVVLLSRPESAKKVVPPGVQVATVDYTDPSAVAAVFKEHKVDVVLSTLGSYVPAAQTPLVEAAKLAAVKLFAPSEYGMPTNGFTEGALGVKAQIAGKDSIGGALLGSDEVPEDLKAAGIPSARFYTGMFPEIMQWFVGYTEHGKVRIVGTGEVPVSFTSVPDIAGFVAHVLTTLPPSELENREFRMEGERATLNDLGPLFKTSVEHVDRITGEKGESMTSLFAILESGAGSTGWNQVIRSEELGSKAAGSANALWPGHKWLTIQETLNL